MGFFRHTYDFPFRKKVYLPPVQTRSGNLICCCHTRRRYASVPVSRSEPSCKYHRILIFFPLCVLTGESWNWWICPHGTTECAVDRCYVMGTSLRIYAATLVGWLTISSFFLLHSRKRLRCISHSLRFHIPCPFLSTGFLIHPCLITRTTFTLLPLPDG